MSLIRQTGIARRECAAAEWRAFSRTNPECPPEPRIFQPYGRRPWQPPLGSLCGCEGGDFLEFFGHVALSMPSVVCGLHADPKAGSIAEQLAKARGHGGRNRLPLLKDVVEVLTGNAEQR